MEAAAAPLLDELEAAQEGRPVVAGDGPAVEELKRRCQPGADEGFAGGRRAAEPLTAFRVTKASMIILLLPAALLLHL